MNKGWCVAVALSGLLASAAQAGLDAAQQPYSKEVLFPKQPGEEIFGATLDSDVYRVAPVDYADMRLVAPDGEEIPYTIEKAIETTARTLRDAVSGRVESLNEQASNRLDVVWVLGDNEASPSGFRFETPLKNFERRLAVFGENADGSRAVLASEALLYDYTRFMDVRSVEVALPTNTFRRFRFVIDDITDEKASPFTELTRSYRGTGEERRTERLSLEKRPLRIDRISAWRDREVEQVSKGRLGSYAVAGFEVRDDKAKAQTIVTVRCRREPLTALYVETESRNFNRSFELEGLDAEAPRQAWTAIARGTVSRIQFRSAGTNHLQIAFPEQRREQYRIAIENGDNAPLRITGVRAEGSIYRLVFLHAAERPCRLYCGSDALRAPKYDTAAVLAAVRKGNAVVEIGLGPEVRNPDVKTGGWKWRRVLNSKAFFIGVVVLVVAALGWGLFRAVGKTDAKNAE